MQNFNVCPGKKGCPYFLSVMGMCFSECDLSSSLKCGDCAHWLGDCAHGEERSKTYGSCFYTIGRVSAHFTTSCSHYTERKEDEMNYVDWCEKRVEELGGNPKESSKEVRLMRIQARKEWAANHN